jgi:hypothetical protein
MDTDCIAVFTARSPSRIVREGGSQAWTLDAARVRKLPYLVCVQNLNNPDRDFSDASEPHGSAYLVGRIADVVPSPEDPNSGRWMIQISEYSTIQNPDNVWKGWRNPVKYGRLEEFKIELDKLKFHSVSEFQKDLRHPELSRPSAPPQSNSLISPMPLSAAKLSLAAFYDVPLDAIEIIIRG